MFSQQVLTEEALLQLLAFHVVGHALVLVKPPYGQILAVVSLEAVSGGIVHDCLRRAHIPAVVLRKDTLSVRPGHHAVLTHRGF